MSANVSKMAHYARFGKPWHNDSTQLDDNASRGEFLSQSGLGRRVNRERLLRSNGEQSNTDAIVLDDNTYICDAPLTREVVQPSALVDFVSPAIEEGLLEIDCGGFLNDSKWTFLTCSYKGGKNVSEVLPGDEVKSYFTLLDSCDGSRRLTPILSNVRTVCMNTAHQALREGSWIALKHTKSVHDKLATLKGYLTQTMFEAEKMHDLFRTFAKKSMTETEFRKFLGFVMPAKVDEKGKPSVKTTNVHDRIVELACTGAGSDIPGIKGTEWFWLNGITHFTTHEAARNSENRLRNLFGSPNPNDGYQLNLRSMATLETGAWR